MMNRQWFQAAILQLLAVGVVQMAVVNITQPPLEPQTRNVTSKGNPVQERTKTFYEASGELIDGKCQCTISTSWSEMEEFNKLVEMRHRLNRVYEVQESMNYELILGKLVNYTSRLQTLEDHINSQSVATSISELFHLRHAISKLEKRVNETDQKDAGTGSSGKLWKELAKIKRFADSTWNRNPYKQRNEFKKQVTELRDYLSQREGYSDGSPFTGDHMHISLPKVEGWCKKKNVRFGRPYTYKYFSQHQNPNDDHQSGSWTKDSKPVLDEDKSRICQAINYETKSTNYNGYGGRSATYSYTKKVRCYKNYTSLLNGITEADYNIQTLHITLYMGSLYYITGGNQLIKKNITTNVKSDVLTTSVISSRNVAYKGKSSDTYIDINADEEGLWLIYSLTSDDKIALSKIDPFTMAIQKTWITGIVKTHVCEAFMVCGRMYTVKTCDNKFSHEEENAVFDTKTSNTYNATYQLASIYGKLESLGYNSRERLVFGWDNGHMVTYPVISPDLGI